MLINIFPSRLKIINTPTIDAKQKDGALHMVGSLADVLLKKKVFKDQVESSLLSTYVFLEFEALTVIIICSFYPIH
jgi:importin-7